MDKILTPLNLSLATAAFVLTYVAFKITTKIIKFTLLLIIIAGCAALFLQHQ